MCSKLRFLHTSYPNSFVLELCDGVQHKDGTICFISRKLIINLPFLQNSLLSALPYFILYIMCLIFGFLSDYLIKTKRLTVGSTRKLFNSIGHYIPCGALIALGYMSKDSPVAAMALLCVVVGCNGGIYSGYIVRIRLKYTLIILAE